MKKIENAKHKNIKPGLIIAIIAMAIALVAISNIARHIQLIKITL